MNEEQESKARTPVTVNRTFREQLLKRLPLLAARNVNPAQVLDIRGDLGGMLDLEPDAFLQPLERLAEKE